MLLPGMILTKTLSGSNGMALLAMGTKVNEKWIDSMESAEIHGVWSRGSSFSIDKRVPS